MENWTSKLNFQALTKEFGSPLYVFDKETLKQRVDTLAALVNGPQFIYYPVKANPCMRVLEVLAERGCSFDCASVHEVNLVLKLDVEPQRLLYNSPALELDLAKALMARGSHVVLDSYEIWQALEQEKLQIKGKVLLRVHPDAEFSYRHPRAFQAHLAHANTHSKFGIERKDLLTICQKASFKISGLHLHVGSRMDNLDVFVHQMRYLHDLKDQIEEQTSQSLDTIDLGGGLGIDFLPTDHYPSLEAYVKTLMPLKQKSLHYWIEPGNALVGPTWALLTTVKATKHIAGKKWAIADVGANQLINMIAFRTPHQILKENKSALLLEGQDALGGPLCFAGDILLANTNLSDVNKGDVLCIQHCGSYCYALSNHFNGFLPPAIVEIDHHKFTLIAKGGSGRQEGC